MVVVLLLEVVEVQEARHEEIKVVTQVLHADTVMPMTVLTVVHESLRITHREAMVVAREDAAVTRKRARRQQMMAPLVLCLSEPNRQAGKSHLEAELVTAGRIEG